MRHWLGIALLLLQGACVSATASAAAPAPVLTPAPKEIAVGEQPVAFGYEWRIDGGEEFPEAAAWLEEEFRARGWEISDGASACVSLRSAEGNGNPEFYTLSITEEGAELGAATREGMFRAAGRFLALLKQPFTVYGEKSFTIPAVAIADWPDFPVRLMSLTMTFWEPFSDAERLDSSKRIISAMAEHGFNHVAIGIGSNYHSKYFQTQKPTPWTDEDIRELVRFAKARGVIPFPYISVISHYGGGPLICPLLNESGTPVGHDILGEEFWEVYPLVLDELVELFDHPPYFRVGGDEANGFFAYLKKSPEECSELFAKTFNFTNEHLKQYNCRTVIWHDMFFAEEMGGVREQIEGIAEGRVEPSPYLMDLVDKDIIINYWHYGADEEYPGIDYFTQAGFEVWSSTWYFTKGIFALANVSGRKNVTGYDGTTWCNNHTKGAELVLVGEVAWNCQTEAVDFDPDEVFMREWSDTPFFANAGNAKPLVFRDGVSPEECAGESVSVGNLQVACRNPIAAAETVFSRLEVPDDIVKIKEEAPDSEIFFAGCEPFVLRPDGINCFRDVGTLILYTPSHGKGTGQNIWGNDYVVIDNCVVERSVEVANVAIPPDGCVISTNITGAELQNNTRKIMAEDYVELILSRREAEGALPKPEAVCGGGADTLVFVFGAALKLYCDKPVPACVVRVRRSDGETDTFSLKCDFSLYPDPKLFKNFRMVYLPDGKAALIWNGDGCTAAGVEMEFTHMGTAIGTVLLGAAEM